MAAALLCVASPASAATRLETLRFLDGNPARSSVVGFRLYIQTQGGAKSSLDLGMPAAGVNGVRSSSLLVAEGASVYLSLTAYDAQGRESAPSNRILRAPRAPAFDHDGDGRSDLLRIDDASGVVEILSHGSDQDRQALGATAPPGSAIVARGDFDASGTADILWRSRDSGELTIWLLGASGDPGSIRSAALPTPGAGLHLVGSGDFDGDGRDDLIFGDAASGDLEIWFLDGASVRQQEAIPGPGSWWRLVGVGDVDADRRSDLVFWNEHTGALRIWHMLGATVLEDLQPTRHLPRGATPIGLGDYDGDGTWDLVERLRWPWIGAASLRDGLGRTSVIAVVGDPQAGVATAHDFEGDGSADLLVVASASRSVSVLLLGAVTGSRSLDFSAGSLPLDVARQIGDRDGDWLPDTCDADFNNDGVVGQLDYLNVVRCIANPAAPDCEEVDFDGNLVVGPPDLLFVLSQHGGEVCR